MADNVVQTIFTADATQAVAAAEAASAATTKAVAKMQEAASKPLSYQSAAQPGSINNPLGRQTVAQREAAIEAAQAASSAAAASATRQKQAAAEIIAANKAAAASFIADQSRVAKATESAEAATARYARTLESAGASTTWQKQVGQVTQYIGKTTAAIGVATGFYAIGSKIREVYDNVGKSLERAADRAEVFAQAMNFSEAEASLKSIDKQIADIQSRAAGREEQGAFSKAIGFLQGESAEAFAAEAARLEDVRTQLVQKAADDRGKKEKEASDKLTSEKKKADEKRAADGKASAKSVQADADKIAAESIEGERERLKALQQLEQKRIADELADATKTKDEQDALFALSKASYAKYQADLTKIAKDESDKREEANKQAVQQMIADWEALRGAIDSAYQAQQQFSSSQFSFGSDIRAIRQLLEVRGGWKN